MATTAENQRARRPAAVRVESAKAGEFPALSMEELERMAADEGELPEMRRMAREELERA